MSFDRADFLKLGEKAATEARRSRQPELLHLKQAAISASNMTGTPEWDVFLQYLQAGVEAASEQRDAFMRDLANPLLVDPNAVAQKRIAVIRLNDRIDTITRIIAMPAEIKHHGRIADEKLKEIAKLDEKEKAA